MATDHDIWAGIKRGDPTLFDAFYREHAPRLLSFVRHIVRHTEAAEDLTQEAFTHLWKSPSGFDPDRGTLRAYLFGIARYQSLDWWHRYKPADEVTDDRPAKANPELQSLMGDALRHLPEEQRSLLWLREVEGHSYTELASILDVPVGTVRSRLFNARLALRSIWHSTHCPKGGPHDLP